MTDSTPNFFPTPLSAVTPVTCLSRALWNDLQDRLMSMAPASSTLTLAHNVYGTIHLGPVQSHSDLLPTAADTESEEHLRIPLPCCPSILCVMSMRSSIRTQTLFIDLVQQILKTVVETDSMSGELVSMYSDIAVLDELGRMLPQCTSISDLGQMCGSLIHGNITAMGCLLIRAPFSDTQGAEQEQEQWSCLHTWGNMPTSCVTNSASTTLLNDYLSKGQAYIIDHDLLPPQLGFKKNTGAWCSIPISNAVRAEGLIILARHTDDSNHRTFTSNDAQLVGIIASHLATYILKLRQDDELRHAQVLAHEVSLAGEIQQKLLPQALEPHNGYHLCGRLHTAEHVGGDYFDHVWDGQYLTLAIADVSGHSVRAALAMTMVRTALHAGYKLYKSPAALLQAMNEQLCDDLAEAGLFVSMMIVRIDSNTGIYRIGCAGHPPLLHRSVDNIITEQDADGMILGFVNDTTYEETSHTLHVGESLLLYTDGIAESLNAAQEMYGDTRLIDSLHRAPHTPTQTLDHIEADAIAWNKGVKNDDCTLLTVARITP